MKEIELLRSEEFDIHLKNGTLRLSFVGMSNAGKSYRSKRLHEELRFRWYNIDEEIFKELGFKNIQEVSAWLGYPYADGYAGREKKYLELENAFTKQAALEQGTENLVFDTTGSVIQLEPETLDALHENSLMVHLDVGEDSLALMMQRFKKEPKPVAWSGFFNKREGETSETALLRCYEELLHTRLKKYRKLAHLNIPAKEVYDTSAEGTLAIIRAHLA